MPLHRIDKQLVCRRFQQAAGSYDRQALIQERMAEHLLDLLGEQSSGPQQRVLEIGCGTGLLTRKLAQRISGMEELVLNDLVPDFASRLPAAAFAPAVRFLPGDIETLPLPGSFDLIISSSTLHWLDDLGSLLTKLNTHLALGGILAFSLYGPDNLREIKELTGITLLCPSLCEIAALLDKIFLSCTAARSGRSSSSPVRWRCSAICVRPGSMPSAAARGAAPGWSNSAPTIAAASAQAAGLP